MENTQSFAIIMTFVPWMGIKGYKIKTTNTDMENGKKNTMEWNRDVNNVLLQNKREILLYI